MLAAGAVILVSVALTSAKAARRSSPAGAFDAVRRRFRAGSAGETTSTSTKGVKMGGETDRVEGG